jgi:hypothetical protein
MYPNAALAEQCQVVTAFPPADLAGGKNGDWVSLKYFDRCSIIVTKGVGTAGQDPTLTLKQAQDVAGTNPKALAINRVDKKQGTQTGIGAFTTSTPGAPATNDTFTAADGTWVNTDAAEAEGLYIVEVQASDLDRANGYDCIQLSFPTPGAAAQITGAVYLLSGGRYGGAGLPSAIVD